MKQKNPGDTNMKCTFLMAYITWINKGTKTYYRICDRANVGLQVLTP